MSDGANIDRRRLVTRAGIAGAAAAAGGVASAGPAEAGTQAQRGLPVLGVHDDWAQVLARTPQVQLVPGATYVLSSTVELPDQCLIVGNAATVTVASDSVGALAVRDRRDIAVHNLRLLGRVDDPIDTAAVFEHVALRIERSTGVRISNCDFAHWRGAGLAITGSTADDYFGYRVQVHDNTFSRCYFGMSTADRSEYSQLSDNHFSYCRLAIWNSSGNWTISGNIVVACYGAYYSYSKSSPYGTLTSDNWGHGAVVGNTFNHANGGARGLWNEHAAFPLGGVAADPGHGVIVGGVLPPTFTGNTLWYTDISAEDLVGTRWLLSGSTFSNLTITATGAVPVHLLGTQANGEANLPRLVGNVKDLLAELG